MLASIPVIRTEKVLSTTRLPEKIFFSMGNDVREDKKILFYAARYGSIAMIKLFLDRGANIHTQRTVLAHVIREDNTPCLSTSLIIRLTSVPMMITL